jgi:type 1 glutamine amidotransferase
MVTGQSNPSHNWAVSSQILKGTLEDTGLFTVDMAVSPAKGQDMSGFAPDFAKYNVVVLDYEGDEWPEGTKKAFVDYVANGGGVVVFHATDNAFPKWVEFNEIIGLGGWGGRDEKSGPMIRWRDGKIVRDETPGKAGTHPPSHDFQVINRDTEHPITKGLPEKWMQPMDELYSALRGPAKNLTVLSTAYCDSVKRRGTGEHEPVLFTIDYGKGRVFHTVLGHAGPKDKAPIRCFDSVGFIVTFQRGAEWAATGNVTQKVPDDFPIADKVSVREGYSAFNK